MEQETQAATIIAICATNSTLGVSCYDELSNTILCDSVSFAIDDLENIINDLKASLKPTLFVLHPRIVSNKSMTELILANPGGPEYHFQVLKSSNWNDKYALEKIHHSLRVRSMGTHNASDSFQMISSRVSLDNSQLRQSLGSLLEFMQMHIFHLDEGKIIVSSIKQLQLDSFMKIDNASLRALQVFCEEIHPNVMKGAGRSKEGFSLFGLFDRTLSLPGRQKLREWMSNPYYDKQKILERQRGVAFVVRDANRDFIGTASAILKHLHDIPRNILRIKKVEANYTTWCKIHTSLQSAMRLLDHIHQYTHSDYGSTSGRPAPIYDSNDIVYMQAMVGLVNVNELRSVLQVMEHAMDFEQSEASRSIVIRDGYDPQLDHMRTVYENLEAKLVEAAHSVLDVVPALQNVSIEYVPQIGYLVAVAADSVHLLEAANEQAPLSKRPRTSAFRNNQGINESDFSQLHVNIVEDRPATVERRQQGFQFVYSQDEVHYFKHPIVYHMDETVGDIKTNILDRQRQLLLEVEETILESEPQLQHLSLILATLDALISLGTLAIEQNLVRPELSDDPVIIIKNGRHMVQNLTVDNFIPNDTFLNAEKNVALITGPNTSGKSVYMKQVGLIVFLTHIGSYVPCDRAIIGLTDKLLTRINSVETVSTPQSSFSLDLHQVSKMLASHTKNSLCLVDEFGKGTSPVDGIALLASTVKHFVEHKGKALFVLHFTEILHPTILLKAHMDSILCFYMETVKLSKQQLREREGRDNMEYSDALDDADDGWEEATPLYKLKLGVATSSEGIPCAKHAGVSQEILRRAVEIRTSIESKQPIQPNTAVKCGVLNDSVNCALLKRFIEMKNWKAADNTTLQELKNSYNNT